MLTSQVWFVTNLSFIDGPTSFGSLDWDEDKWTPRALGEVFGQSRRYNGLWSMPGLTGQHVCGTPEQFLDGAPYPAVGPPVEYDDDGIPLCCGRALVGFVSSAARPGAAFNYVARPTSRVSSAARPGARVSRVYNPVVAVSSAARPGALIDGPPQPTTVVSSAARPGARVAQIHNPTVAVCSAARPGALVEGPPQPTTVVSSAARPGALVSLTHNPTVAVSSAARPAAAVVVDLNIPPRVSSAARPAAAVVVDLNIPPRVSSAARPAALNAQIHNPTVVVSSAARPAALNAQIHNPTVVVSSAARPAAVVEYAPFGPAPGNSCETSGVLALNVPHDWDGVLFAQDWWVCQLGPAGAYHARITTPDSGALTHGISGSCSVPNLFTFFFGTGCFTYYSSADDELLFVRHFPSSTATYQIEFGDGECP